MPRSHYNVITHLMNLVVNGGFQTGTFAGWNPYFGSTISTAGRPNGPPPHYAADITPGGIYQTLPCTGNTTYYLSFWARATSGDIRYGVGQSLNPSGFNFVLAGVNPLTPSWTFFSYSFTTAPGAFQLLLDSSGDGGIGVPRIDILVDDYWLSTIPVCYTGDTLIRSINLGSRILEDARADQITPSTHRVLNTVGEEIEIVENVVSGPTERLVTFPRGSLGDGLPSDDLRLTRGHKLVVGEEEIRAGDHPAGVYGRCDPTLVYSIICPTRQHIYANNQPVVASGLDEWNEIKSRVSHRPNSSQ